MKSPTVSIIVPCYKQEEYLNEAIDSVLSQTFSEWECIIVNDGSPGNTEGIAQNYCEKDSRIHYHYQNNQGIAMARNNGIKLSSGKYILPLDADDKIDPTYLEKAISYLESNPQCKLVYCKTEFFGEKNGIFSLPEYSYDKEIWVNCIINSAIFRRSDFEKTAGYNSNMRYGFEDWDFYLSLLTPTDEVFQINEILFSYRQKKVSRSTLLLLKNRLKESHRQLIENHKDIYLPYLPQIIDLYNEAEEKKKIAANLDRVYKSPTFRIGKAITNPVKFLLRLMDSNYSE